MALPNIFKMLDLSTAHLPEALGQDLKSEGGPGVVAYELTYGWLLWVPEDIDEHIAQYDSKVDDPNDIWQDDNSVPDAVVAIWRYAAKHGCQYVMLDRDAYKSSDLPTYDW